MRLATTPVLVLVMASVPGCTASSVRVDAGAPLPSDAGVTEGRAGDARTGDARSGDATWNPAGALPDAAPCVAGSYAWECNALGVAPSSFVPEPWKPIALAQTGDDSVATLSGGAAARKQLTIPRAGVLPSGIRVNDRPLLRAAPVLNLRIGGVEQIDLRPQLWSPKAITRTSSSLDYGVIRSEASHQIEARVRLEYDGFLQVSLTVRPKTKAAVLIDQLSLTLPFASGVGKYLSSYLAYDFVSGGLSRTSLADSYVQISKNQDLPFNPAVWVGNDEMGVEWAAETDLGWSRRVDAQGKLLLDAEGKPVPTYPVHIVRDASSDTTMTVDLVSADLPRKISKAITYSFSLYPTPIKDYPADGHRYVLTQLGANAQGTLKDLSQSYFPPGNPSTYSVHGVAWSLPVLHPALPGLTPTGTCTGVDCCDHCISKPTTGCPAESDGCFNCTSSQCCVVQKPVCGTVPVESEKAINPCVWSASAPAAQIASKVQAAHDCAFTFVPYSALYHLVVNRPEWHTYQDRWSTGAETKAAGWAAPQGLCGPKAPNAARMICLSDPSYTDFFVYQFWRAIQDSKGSAAPIGGVYLDVAAPSNSCTNPTHAHHWKNATGDPLDEWTQYYPLFVQRGLLKRLYVATKYDAGWKTFDRGFRITLHHGKTPLTLAGFADAVLSGEPFDPTYFRQPGYEKNPKEDTLSEFGTHYIPNYAAIPAVLWKIEYSRQRGYVPMLLPLVKKWNEALVDAAFSADHLTDPAYAEVRLKVLEWSRRMLTRTTLHGVGLELIRFHRPSFEPILKARDHHGWEAPGEFFPPGTCETYFQNDTTAPRLAVSCYLDLVARKAMVVVANLTAGSLSRQVCPTAAVKAGLNVAVPSLVTAGVAAEAVVGAPDASGCFNVKVSGNSYVMVVFKGPPS